MSELLFIRHAKSYANARNPAFGNLESPLDDKGIYQALGLRTVLAEEFGVIADDYSAPVLASEYQRTQETAQRVGFKNIATSSLVNETELPEGMLGGREIVTKHASERWVPDEVMQRSKLFIDDVRSGNLDYKIIFTHGLYIAALLLQLSSEDTSSSKEIPMVFSKTRGYIPDLATITPIEI